MSTAEKFEVLQAELDQALAKILKLKRQLQHQGEPVALPEKKRGSVGFAKGIQDGWNACLDEITKLGPLYIHPNPNVRWEAVANEQVKVIDELKPEVERLRAEIEEWNRIFDMQEGKIDALRAKLAEAHALLQDFVDCPWNVEEATIPKAGIEAAPQNVVGTMHVGLVRLRKVRAWLSASAEPSAPVEIDERAEFESTLRLAYPDTPISRDGHGYKNPYQNLVWVFWKARAALEHKQQKTPNRGVLFIWLINSQLHYRFATDQ